MTVWRIRSSSISIGGGAVFRVTLRSLEPFRGGYRTIGSVAIVQILQGGDFSLLRCHHSYIFYNQDSLAVLVVVGVVSLRLSLVTDNQSKHSNKQG